MSILTSITKHRYLLIALAILLLALGLRLRGLDTTGLWGDQAFTLNTAMRWVNGGDMPLAANKSSVGFVNPPMIEYLYAAALAVWPDILSVSALTLLGGMMAIAVTGFVTGRIFGRRAGLWTMMAFAVAPWAVVWSQLIWNQTMVPPFAALALGGLLLYLAERPRAVYLVGAFAAAAVMTQVHPGTAVQLGTIGLALLLFHRRVRWTHVAAGAAVFAALYLPYLAYQIGTGWADFRAMGDLAGEDPTLSAAAVLLSLDLIHAQGLHRSVAGVVRFDALISALFIISLALVGWRWWRGPGGVPSGAPPVCGGAAGNGWPAERVALTVLLLWFLIPLLFYLRSSVYLQNYYLIGQWPTHFMILGIGLDTAQRAAGRLAAQATTGQARRAWPVIGLVIPTLFLLSVAYQVFFTLSHQNIRAVEVSPHMQVRQARAMINTSRDLLSQADGWRLVGIGQGHQVESSNLALLEEFVDPERVLLTDGDLALPRPSPYAYYLDTRPGSAAANTLVTSANLLPGVAIQMNNEVWPFYTWAEDDGGVPVAPLAAWEMGLELTGFERGELNPGEEMPLALNWHIRQRPPDTLYHFGVYLLDQHDTVLAQHDGPGFDSIQWQAGDGFITYHQLPIPADLPAGIYRLAVALYTWPDLARAELTGGGNTAWLEEIPYP
ncbi:MAG: hypothetical protein DCC51_08880 [Anaerolineae bacterium]|nr:MAG: hypothetical protein DCC51_08880 [Anaerolineae bacterium]